MAEKLLMIALSPTMETGTIGTWQKQEGDEIVSGDVICEVETDKATMDYEAVQEGTLLRILVEEGGAAAVGQPIGIIGKAGENIDDLVREAQKELESGDSTAEGGTESAQAQAGPSAKEVRSETAQQGPPVKAAGGGQGPSSGHVKSSPLARALADKHGIDIASVNGSGPDGRVVKRDIEKAVRRQSGASAQEGAAGGPRGAGEAVYAGQDEVKPVSRKRRVIADRLSESKFGAPHYYLKLRAAVDLLLEARKQLNADRREGKVSFNTFLIKLAAEALKRHPEVRSTWQGDSILTHGSIDIGIAVAQPDGLITPVIKNCGGKGILQIDRELKDLVDKARTNKLSPDEYQGAVFTISNLGSYGIDEFTAIINPPGSAILAVGAIRKEELFDSEDNPRLQQMLSMTLSCDHRVIDGAVGALFMKDLKNMLENPVTALY
jgi:pyruvate dehydrogenase E2 component (dihydrolipoamide acetyltransferase)